MVPLLLPPSAKTQNLCAKEKDQPERSPALSAAFQVTFLLLSSLFHLFHVIHKICAAISSLTSLQSVLQLPVVCMCVCRISVFSLNDRNSLSPKFLLLRGLEGSTFH